MKTKKRDSQAVLPHLTPYVSMVQCAAIFTAVELGLFHHLNKPMTDIAVARSLKIPVKGITPLLEILVAVAYLKKRGPLYSPSPFVKKWLSRNSTFDYTPAFLWMAEAWKILETLPDSIRRGNPSTTLWQHMRRQPELGRKFSRYMLVYARHGLEGVLKKIKIPSRSKTLLDIGGSHGLHSVSLCRKFPQMKAVIFDLPGSLKETPKLIKQYRLEKRVKVMAGNTMTDDWGQNYDVVLFFSLLHNHSPQQNRHLFKKIFKSLNPGGVLIIHDYLSDSPTPDYNTAFNLTLFSEVGTRIFSFREISSWLDHAGFLTPKKIALTPLESGTLLVALKG